ncbi:SDR family NAD(P)-dependent oxidoreductase [Dactylosporangium sucinum]|uniref:SDR family NAD(P)-dependent oxidoreductase n=1 Tax=Dactylosporangium sucinum TaxID=1424081 RepID=A0A917TNI3_9ACTN|nr:SDR family NAD(P)-dependent oxidoreductase [Dactylosporangium sucinum]GGM28887.1 hypothetical protein GCM10007977_032660 [Dactylosporangium sucinum]
MNNALGGKVTLVTGGSRGIGKAIAERLAGGKADLAITCRESRERAEAVADGIRAQER